jgi:long-chain acyl-CoA synthetase
VRDLRDLAIDARRFPERHYLVQGERRVTFADHEAAVSSVTAVLREHGVRPGDRVMLLGANSIEWVVCFWAVLETGAIAVLGNGWWSGPELDYALATTTPSLVVADQARSERVPASQRRMGFAELTGAIAVPAAAVAERPPAREDDPSVIVFTSGTTGLPKGAVLSHRCVIATLHAVLERTRRLPAAGTPPPPSSALRVSLPLFHVGGFQQLMMPMVGGSTLVFTEGRFDAARVARLIEDEAIRVWSAVPTMVTRVLDYLEDHDLEPLTSVRTIALGGSPVTEQIRARVPTKFPSVRSRLAVAYGLTEAAGSVAAGAGGEILERPGTVGRPLATASVRIDQPDPAGAGEVLVRAPFVMLGYWQPAGQPTLIDPGPISSDRWLHTGDVGRLDDDGYLYITDRSKDIVIRGGENIATPHVENCLLAHPAVGEVAVIGLPHASLGEELAAIVVLRQGQQATAGELRSFAAATLAHFEIPTQWRFRTEPLPQNVAGKVLKRELRTEWTDEIAQETSPV